MGRGADFNIDMIFLKCNPKTSTLLHDSKIMDGFNVPVQKQHSRDIETGMATQQHSNTSTWKQRKANNKKLETTLDFLIPTHTNQSQHKTKNHPRTTSFRWTRFSISQWFETSYHCSSWYTAGNVGVRR
jgi:hypothetical protein